MRTNLLDREEVREHRPAIVESNRRASVEVRVTLEPIEGQDQTAIVTVPAVRR